MKNPTNTNITADEQWVREHLEELVDNYPGQYAVVAEGELFVGQDAVQLDQEARRKHPGVIPLGLPVPRPEDFVSAFIKLTLSD